MTKIVVYQEELWLMIISTIRYSMGRTSGVAWECWRLITGYRKHLTDQQLKQIREEVQSEVQKQEAKGQLLGHATDHEAWQRIILELADVK